MTVLGLDSDVKKIINLRDISYASQRTAATSI
jgi:hypothetical protein